MFLFLSLSPSLIHSVSLSSSLTLVFISLPPFHPLSMDQKSATSSVPISLPLPLSCILQSSQTGSTPQRDFLIVHQWAQSSGKSYPLKAQVSSCRRFGGGQGNILEDLLGPLTCQAWTCSCLAAKTGHGTSACPCGQWESFSWGSGS